MRNKKMTEDDNVPGNVLILLGEDVLRLMIQLINNIPYFPAHKTHFFSRKCDLNSTCNLCAEGKYYFLTYKYPYIYYTTSLSWDSENNHEDDFSVSDDDFLGFYDE